MREQVEIYLKAYGAMFQEKREQCKLTQLEVAHQLGISQAIIGHIETGHMLPNIEIEEALHQLYALRSNT